LHEPKLSTHGTFTKNGPTLRSSKTDAWTSVGIWDATSTEPVMVKFPGTLIGSGLIARLFNWIGSELGPQFLHDKLKSDNFVNLNVFDSIQWYKE